MVWCNARRDKERLELQQSFPVLFPIHDALPQAQFVAPVAEVVAAAAIAPVAEVAAAAPASDDDDDVAIVLLQLGD